MAERTNRLSPQGRLRCAESGARNLEAWRASAPRVVTTLEGEVATFRAQLEDDPAAAALAAKRAATTVCYMALRLAETKLLKATRRPRRIESLFTLLVPVVSELRRNLAALGLSAAVAEPDSEAQPLGRWPPGSPALKLSLSLPRPNPEATR